MNFKQTLASGVIVVLALALPVGIYLLEQEPTELMVEESEEEVLTYDVPDFATEEPRFLGEGGPWEGRLDLHLSADGLEFGLSEVVLERAGVPSMTVMPDGRLLLIFQWFPEDSEWFDYPAVMFSSDKGQTWTDPEPILMANYPDSFRNPFDPTVVVTEEGMVRLYFTGNPDGRQHGPDADTAIYSALSEDGIHYVMEEGVRFDDDAYEFTRDSTVAQLDGVWHLYTPHADENGQVNHATSEDGLNFEVQEDIHHESANWTGNVMMTDGMLRFYGGGSVVESADGFEWSELMRVNVHGGDPAVVQLEDGSFVLVSVGFNPQF